MALRIRARVCSRLAEARARSEKALPLDKSPALHDDKVTSHGGTAASNAIIQGFLQVQELENEAREKLPISKLAKTYPKTYQAVKKDLLIDSPSTLHTVRIACHFLTEYANKHELTWELQLDLKFTIG